MTADLHECNGVGEGHGVESGEVEVGEIRKTTLVEENLKSSKDKTSCNGENKCELQCMPNGSIDLASQSDVTDDNRLESHIEAHDYKVEEVSNGKDEASELEIGCFNENIIDGDSDKSGETYGLSNSIEQSVLLENIADRDDWVILGDPFLSNKSVLQISSNQPKLELVSNGKDEASELVIGCFNESIIDGASDKSGETSELSNRIEQSVLLKDIAERDDWVMLGDPVLSNKSVPQSSSTQQKLELDIPKKTFYCLVKTPGHIDNEIKEQIRLTELQLIGKSKIRDFIRETLAIKRSSKHQLLDSLKSARQEEKAIREAIKATQHEMEPAQLTLNKMKNANSGEEYDKKLLGEELESLKKQLFQAEKDRHVIEKEFNELNDALRQLQIQWKAADADRQEPIDALNALRKLEYERNKEFFKNKADIQKAKEHGLAGDSEALEKLCSNQVERIIEMWNKNAEFRKEYIKDNERRWKIPRSAPPYPPKQTPV